jgi:NhaA family Na+:H+ antiporter
VAGIVFTGWFGFVQLRKFKLAVDVVRGKYDEKGSAGEVNHFQALTAAVSGTVGLGNIAGVTVAVSIGGPGATFWMILCGLLGMATKRTPATAALPVIAAACGMAVPAALYALVASTAGGELHGWAVPMATDIAFALAVLAVISTHLPAALRAFLLTLTVLDDLGAILIIALFFTSDLNLWALGGAFGGLAVFHLLQRLRVRGWWWYVPLGLVIWALMYNGGVHATVAGVAMGLILRTTPDKGEEGSPAARVSHLVHPFSAGVAVPLFALFAAGVSMSGAALAHVFTDLEPLAVFTGLVAGKILGVFLGTYLAARFTRARLNPELAWADVFGLAVLAGIGFTVALLLGELPFTDPALTEHVKAAVLLGSLTAAALAALLLRRRNRVYQRLYEEEERDDNADGIPDIYQVDILPSSDTTR